MKLFIKVKILFLIIFSLNCGNDMNPQGECKNVVKIVNPNGKLHGEVCKEDNECKYGRCVSAPSITKGMFKICTKDCSCGELSECYIDDNEAKGLFYKCQRLSGKALDTIKNMCTPICQNVDFCAQFSSQYNSCEILTGTYKTCLVK